MDNSNYETTDWDAEARRVMRAFGIDEECHFEEVSLKLTGVPDSVSNWFCWQRDEVRLTAEYSSQFKSWGVSQFIDGQQQYAAVTLDYDNTILRAYRYGEFVGDCALELARILFFLELLTPEIEAEIEVAVSEHQKLEWLLKQSELDRALNPPKQNLRRITWTEFWEDVVSESELSLNSCLNRRESES